MRLNVNSTSSALNSRVGLKYGVVWNLTPSRRWKVYVRPSGETSQLVARPGTTAVPPRSNWLRRLNTVSAEASKSVPVVYWPGSKPAGLPSEQNTRLVAAWAKGAAAIRPALTKSGRTACLSMLASCVVVIFAVDGDPVSRTADTYGAAIPIERC